MVFSEGQTESGILPYTYRVRATSNVERQSNLRGQISHDWNPSAHVLSGSGRSLLANSRVWSRALDVQYRQPALGDWFVLVQSQAHANCHYLDDPWSFCVVPLCGARLGSFLYFHSRTCRWADRWNVCVATNRNGSRNMALCVWLVLDSAIAVESFYRRRAKRKPCSPDTAWMGATVRVLLGILVSTYSRDSNNAVGGRDPVEEHLASETGSS